MVQNSNKNNIPSRQICGHKKLKSEREFDKNLFRWICSLWLWGASHKKAWTTCLPGESSRTIIVNIITKWTNNKYRISGQHINTRKHNLSIMDPAYCTFNLLKSDVNIVHLLKRRQPLHLRCIFPAFFSSPYPGSASSSTLRWPPLKSTHS